LYLWGSTKFSQNNVKVREGKVCLCYKAGDFVCEYRGVVQQKKGNEDWGDQRNSSLGLGCYCFDATTSMTQGGTLIMQAKTITFSRCSQFLTGED